MNWFQKLSIRRKQTLVIMLTSSVVLLLACAAFSIYETIAFRNTMKQNLATLADIVDHNITAALDFNDTKSGEETLAALQADPTIVGAWLYTKDGQAFAKYDRPNDGITFAPPAILPNGTIFRGQRLILCRPVVLKGETAGTLYLETDMQALHARLLRYALIAGLVFVAAWLIAFALSNQLQRLVSDPILQLAQVARSVALEKNYSIRAIRRSGDELGQLIDGFNEMLEQIQERDVALQTARDQLEQRVQERTIELAQSQALYHSLVEQLPLGVFRKDNEGRYVFGNSWYCRLKGISARQLLGKTAQEVLASKFTAIELQNPAQIRASKLAGQGALHHEQIMRTGRPIELEEESPGIDGQPRYFHAVKSPVFDSEDRIIGSQGILMDITDRKRTEAQRVRLADIVEASPDFIGFADPKTAQIQYINKHGRRMCGIGEDEDIAKLKISDVHPAWMNQRLAEVVLPTAARDGLWEGEGAFLNRNGREIPVSMVLLARKDESGEVDIFYTVSRDITERKRAEVELAKANRELLETSRQAGMAEVATSVLHNVGNVLNSVNVSATLVVDNTRKSKAPYLDRVVALLNEHAADLGVFMTTDPKGMQLPGYLGQLAGQLAREQQSAIAELESLRKNIEHIKDIVAMQQTYAKVSGVTETLQVSDLVEDALRINASALARHEVQVIREYGEVAPLTIDKHKVLQVLVNLIRNAKYACDDSGRADKQMTLCVASGDKRVRISITDNGVGIPAENLTRIFNHGFTTRKEGHGFGLHSGALAAKEMGGSLTVHSGGPGQGATFTLELPQEKASSAQSNAA